MFKRIAHADMEDALWSSSRSASTGNSCTTERASKKSLPGSAPHLRIRKRGKCLEICLFKHVFPQNFSMSMTYTLRGCLKQFKRFKKKRSL